MLRVRNRKMKMMCCDHKVRKFLLKDVESIISPIPCHWVSRSMAKKDPNVYNTMRKNDLGS